MLLYVSTQTAPRRREATEAHKQMLQYLKQPRALVSRLLIYPSEEQPT